MDDLERRIRERAYRIWVEEGRPEGRAAEHWEKARELVTGETDGGESAPPTTTERPAASPRDRVEPMPSAATERPREPPMPTDAPPADMGGKPAAPKRRRRR